MKMWQKILSLFLVASITVFISCAKQERKDCFLCSSFRYHAPCLVDLETGRLVELDLYCPHPSLVAELADFQPVQETFSLVCLGNVSGVKDTSQMAVNINIPSADETDDPALCAQCRSGLQTGYKGRYVLADLYDKDAKTLIPIQDNTSIILRCYDITMQHQEDIDVIAVNIRGLLTVEKPPVHSPAED